MYACVCMRVYVCMCIVCVCMYVHVCIMSVCHVCMHVCMYACMYVCIVPTYVPTQPASPRLLSQVRQSQAAVPGPPVPTCPRSASPNLSQVHLSLPTVHPPNFPILNVDQSQVDVETMSPATPPSHAAVGPRLSRSPITTLARSV